MSSLRIINAKFQDAMGALPYQKMAFADPPDNVGLDYHGSGDKRTIKGYTLLLSDVLWTIHQCDVLWISFNAHHMSLMGRLVDEMIVPVKGWSHRFLMQHCTFGYYNQTDFGHCYRPLLRIMRDGADVYPDAIRIESERQRLGDKRANPEGKIPGDVWDFPRVTGNSKQRRKWHPTQLHEGLYERCLKYSCAPGDSACDLFAGTGTMARAAKDLDLDVTLIDLSEFYCGEIAAEHRVMYETL